MAESKVLSQVKDIVSRTLKISLEKLDVDADFDDFGIDSIIAMELMSNLSTEMNISITPAQFTEVNTIKELAISIEELTDSESIEEPEPVPAIQASQVEEVQEVPLTPVYEEVNPIPQTTRSTNRQRTTSRRSNTPDYKKVLDKIQQQFSIDLSYRKFRSIEEIADTLVTSHLDDLLAHYNISDEPVDTSHATQTNNEPVFTDKTTTLTETDAIAIVGISCNFPDAPDAPTYWKNLIEKKNSIKEIPESRWNWKEYYSETGEPGKTNSKWAALIDKHDCFDAQFFNIEADEAKIIDPQERLLLEEVYKSFQDGGISPAELKGTNTGVFVSYEYSEYEHYLRNNIDKLELGENKPFFSSSSPTYFLSNRVSFMYDFNGPSESFNVNCAGSAVAINRAYNSLRTNETNVAVVGGVSLNLFADDYIALSKYDMLSPDGTCAVFDDEANGFTRGEGVASVVLKRLKDAEKDNNKIYGIIKSSHQNNRGKARFMQEIDTESITDVISDCYKNAEINPSNVHYIEVDGYATKWADSFEYEGIKQVFKTVKTNEKTCALGSLKGNIGNLESVNGLASFIKLALALQNKKFPPTITKKKVNAFIDIDKPTNPLYIADQEIPFDAIRKDKNTLIRAGINAFADTGVNVHILLEEYPGNNLGNAVEPNEQTQLFVLSAKDENRLAQMVNDYIEYFSEADESQFINTIYTLQTGREAMQERLAIVASSIKELLKKLNLVKKGFNQKKAALEKQDVFVGSTKQNDENPLNGIFTDDMARMLIYQNQQEDRWKKIAKLWITGFDIPWKLIWEDIKATPVSLPLYPFQKERYWAELTGNASATIINNGAEQKSTPIKKTSSVNTTNQPEWYFYVTAQAIKEESSLSNVDKIELFLQQQIAILLKSAIKEVSTKTDFLELGLNSIDIGTFVSNTMNLLDITMSPAIIFNNPDISSLAAYLSDTYSEKLDHLSVTKDAQKAARDGITFSANTNNTTAQDHILIPLQPKGNKTPIYAVSPGGNGTSLAFQHLVQALGKDQPFYGLEFAYNSQLEPESFTIEHLAQTNVEAIKKIQPEGPYSLMGLSNGGMIAFEMAKIMLEKGDEVTSLSFLDSFSPLQPVIDIIDEIIGVFNGKFASGSAEKLNIDSDKLKSLPETDRFDYLYAAIVDFGFEIPKEQFKITYDIARTMDLSCRAYSPSKLEENIKTTLFRATQGYMEGYEDLPEDYSWNQLLPEPIQIIRIEADHFSITDKEPSTAVAKKIKTLAKKPKLSKKNA